MAILAGLLLVLAVACVLVPMPASSVAGGGPQQKAQPIDFADDEVLIGAFLQNIQSIDPTTNSFLADPYIWFRWGNPDLKPYESLEVMNWYEAWQMMAPRHADEATRTVRRVVLFRFALHRRLQLRAVVG